jgi:hypothetical protein
LTVEAGRESEKAPWQAPPADLEPLDRESSRRVVLRLDDLGPENLAPAIAIEGAVDRFCGRPPDQNPYSRQYAALEWEAWRWGWRCGGGLLEMRGQEEAARWLQEVA